jgi:hypothetical protein
MRSFKFEAHQTSLVGFLFRCPRILLFMPPFLLQEGDDLDTEASEGGGSSLARLDDFGGEECDGLHEDVKFDVEEDGAPESSAEPSHLSEQGDGGG